MKLLVLQYFTSHRIMFLRILFICSACTNYLDFFGLDFFFENPAFGVFAL